MPSATWPLMMTVETDFSCELAKPQAKAIAKSKRIDLSWEMQNIDVPRKKSKGLRFTPHLYTNEEQRGKREENTRNRYCATAARAFSASSFAPGLPARTRFAHSTPTCDKRTASLVSDSGPPESVLPK